MSSTKSWLAQLSPNRSRHPSRSSYDFPRWRTPSPSASMIPPPIVQSTYEPPPAPIAESKILAKPTEFQDRQYELEADLQFLLDAQAEGLIKGLEGGSLGDRSSTGSTTPTAPILRSPSRNSRKPIRRQPGLKSARKGIYNSIVALARLKDEELREIDAGVRENDATLQQIESWERKRDGLQEASQHVDSSKETIRIQRLRQQADAMQVEINRVELQLAEMKTNHRRLLSQAAAIENTVQAKMASYTSSLRLLEEDIKKFLSFTPENVETHAGSDNGTASVWQLPPARRNLQLAKEYWAEQREVSLQQRKDTGFEKSALVEGAALWRDTVTEVAEFEKRLRSEMSALPSSPGSQSAWEDPPLVTNHENSSRLTDLLAKIGAVIASLELKLRQAEEQNWRLLMAAIGAELDALKRGKQLLDGVLVTTAEDRPPLDSSRPEKLGSGDEIHALDQSFATARPSVGPVSDTDDDDEPPPELLFSQAREVDG
jgi:hypothetical protein